MEETKEKLEEKVEEKKEETPQAPFGVLGEARAIAQALKEENAKTEKLLQQMTALRAEEMLGGRAGGFTKEEPKPMSDVDYAKAVMRGEVNPLDTKRKTYIM